MDDFDEILTKHPEIILISKSPPSWKGFLSINNNYTNCKMKIKVKLVVPSYPRLDNAIIHFGGNIAFLFGKHLKNQIDSIIKKSESVPCFFEELATVIVCKYYLYLIFLILLL